MTIIFNCRCNTSFACQLNHVSIDYIIISLCNKIYSTDFYVFVYII